LVLTQNQPISKSSVSSNTSRAVTSTRAQRKIPTSTCIEQLLSAYDTEKRLQEQELAPNFSVEDFVIEAGPTYFEGAAKQVEEGIESIAAQLAQRNAAPYSSTKMQ
jgi:hypothetical protein